MADESPAGSPLSSLSSDFDAEDDHDEITAEAMPPSKKRKIEQEYLEAPKFHDDAISISSDSSGEVPASPGNRLDDDDNHEQVTICTWTGCDEGDLGNMDKLVEHIHNEHIETRGKKYTCEWSDCGRKGLPHASAYALKAHMRSHTREKPFYCSLPGKISPRPNLMRLLIAIQECDRAFTRSDALAKHHRTVHETESLRPSDPIPKSMQAAQRSSRLKMVLKVPQPHMEGHILGPMNGTTNGDAPPGWVSSYPPELAFTPEEEARGPKQLYRLLRRQVHWAEEEAESLKQSAEMMEELRKKEWLEKEIILDQALKTELDWHERRQLVLAGSAEIPTADAIKAAADRAWNNAYSPPAIAASSPSPFPIKGQPVEDQREAAAVLASLHQA